GTRTYFGEEVWVRVYDEGQRETEERVIITPCFYEKKGIRPLLLYCRPLLLVVTIVEYIIKGDVYYGGESL
ncbi:MAG: hypothetical protein RLZZ230_468, partial [Candidatus Parcubacteria bacterium]